MPYLASMNRLFCVNCIFKMLGHSVQQAILHTHGISCFFAFFFPMLPHGFKFRVLNSAESLKAACHGIESCCFGE